MINAEKSHYLFANLSWKDLAALQQKGNLVLLLPMGSTESHGPHAPFPRMRLSHRKCVSDRQDL
jgi:hypothetical protein